MPPRIPMLWFSHLKDKQSQDSFKQGVLGSRFVLDRLHEIVYNIVKNEDSPATADYESPSWAYKQAHLNGRKAAFNEILTLLKFSDNEE